MLKDLIEAHKVATAAFDKCCETLEEKQEAYDARFKDDRINVELYDIRACATEGREWLRDHANDIVDRCRRQLPMIKRLSPEFAEQFEAFIEATKSALYQKIDYAIEQEERRQFEFGLTAVRDDWDRLSAAETAAIEAIASYRCADHAEECERIAYLISVNSVRVAIDDIAPLLIEAVGGAPLQHAGAAHGAF